MASDQGCAGCQGANHTESSCRTCFANKAQPENLLCRAHTCIITREAAGHLRKVVGAEGEEGGVVGQVAGLHSSSIRARQVSSCHFGPNPGPQQGLRLLSRDKAVAATEATEAVGWPSVKTAAGRDRQLVDDSP